MGHDVNHWLEDVLVRRRMFGPSINLLEILACVAAIGGLAALNDWALPEGIPLAVPSMAATAALLFIQPSLTIARSWNAIGGQTVSATGGWIAVVAVGEGRQWLVLGGAAALALIFMSLLRCLHPPGVATAVIMVGMTDPTAWEHIFVPIALGTTLVVAWAWLVHAFEGMWLGQNPRDAVPEDHGGSADQSQARRAEEDATTPPAPGRTGGTAPPT
jgi:CBS domain-containing membrane protein